MATHSKNTSNLTLKHAKKESEFATVTYLTIINNLIYRRH